MSRTVGVIAGWTLAIVMAILMSILSLFGVASEVHIETREIADQ